jgi:hypothetical protein
LLINQFHFVISNIFWFVSVWSLFFLLLKSSIEANKAWRVGISCTESYPMLWMSLSLTVLLTGIVDSINFLSAFDFVAPVMCYAVVGLYFYSWRTFIQISFLLWPLRLDGFPNGSFSWSKSGSSFIILLAVQFVVRCGYWSWRKFDSSALFFFGLLVDMSALISCFESFRCHCFLYSEIWGVLVGTTLEGCCN